MIVMKRTLQQLLGGAPFIISGACGMFRTDVLRKFGFSDRTKVEDLDLTGRWWQTATVFGRRIAASYTHRNVTVRVRSGAAGGVGLWATRSVCACIKTLFSRFGIFSIFPMLLVVLYGVGIYLTTGLMNSSPPGHMVWCWQCSRLSGRRSLCYWCI